MALLERIFAHQVKSRYYNNASGFPIKNPKADFVVFARLNLDTGTRKRLPLPPDCSVFPALIVKRAIEVGPSNKWHPKHS